MCYFILDSLVDDNINFYQIKKKFCLIKILSLKFTYKKLLKLLNKVFNKIRLYQIISGANIKQTLITYENLANSGSIEICEIFLNLLIFFFIHSHNF
jgi:hypothetical protein